MCFKDRYQQNTWRKSFRTMSVNKTHYNLNWKTVISFMGFTSNRGEPHIFSYNFYSQVLVFKSSAILETSSYLLEIPTISDKSKILVPIGALGVIFLKSVS